MGCVLLAQGVRKAEEKFVSNCQMSPEAPRNKAVNQIYRLKSCGALLVPKCISGMRDRERGRGLIFERTKNLQRKRICKDKSFSDLCTERRRQICWLYLIHLFHFVRKLAVTPGKNGIPCAKNHSEFAPWIIRKMATTPAMLTSIVNRAINKVVRTDQ